MPHGTAARVPYCRRPWLVTANTCLGHRSTANPSTLTRLFCRIRDRVFALGPVARIEMLTNHFTARFGQRHADVWGDAVAYATKNHRSRTGRTSKTIGTGVAGARARMLWDSVCKQSFVGSKPVRLTGPTCPAGPAGFAKNCLQRIWNIPAETGARSSEVKPVICPILISPTPAIRSGAPASAISRRYAFAAGLTAIKKRSPSSSRS